MHRINLNSHAKRPAISENTRTMVSRTKSRKICYKQERHTNHQDRRQTIQMSKTPTNINSPQRSMHTLHHDQNWSHPYPYTSNNTTDFHNRNSYGGSSTLKDNNANNNNKKPLLREPVVVTHKPAKYKLMTITVNNINNHTGTSWELREQLLLCNCLKLEKNQQPSVRYDIADCLYTPNSNNTIPDHRHSLDSREGRKIPQEPSKIENIEKKKRKSLAQFLWGKEVNGKK